MGNRNNLSKAEKIINQMRKKKSFNFLYKRKFCGFFLYKNKNKNPYKNSILNTGDRHLFSILDEERKSYFIGIPFYDNK